MDLEHAKSRARGTLVEHLGIEWHEIRVGYADASVRVEPLHLAPNGYLHGGTVVGLADTCCGFGCAESLPEGAESFTTIELKTNFLGTARQGVVRCVGTMIHGGRTTQVWDARVSNEADKTIALFRATQLILYPR